MPAKLDSEPLDYVHYLSAVVVVPVVAKMIVVEVAVFVVSVVAVFAAIKVTVVGGQETFVVVTGEVGKGIVHCVEDLFFRKAEYPQRE